VYEYASPWHETAKTFDFTVVPELEFTCVSWTLAVPPPKYADAPEAQVIEPFAASVAVGAVTTRATQIAVGVSPDAAIVSRSVQQAMEGTRS